MSMAGQLMTLWLLIPPTDYIKPDSQKKYQSINFMTNNKELITKLLHLFESARFEKWYGPNGNFDRYTSGDMTYEEKITHKQAAEKIRNDIANFLDIEDK